MKIQNLPRPARFMFWSTAPFLVLTLCAASVSLKSRRGDRIDVLAAFEALSIFALFGLYDPRRSNWCWRIVGGIVLAGYYAYLISTIASGQWFGDSRRPSTTALSALFGLLVFGYPSFMYAVFGRFTWLAESEKDDYNDKHFESVLPQPESHC